MIDQSKLQKELAIGVMLPDGTLVKDYTLLRSNGIAERVFTDKMPGKPYTWMANVISVALKNIGSVAIGAAARSSFVATESVDIPAIVLQLPIAEANTLLIEIHRIVWKNLLPNQESVCRYCGNPFFFDMDLNRLDYTEEDKKLLASRTDWSETVISLPEGFFFEGLEVVGGSQQNSLDTYKNVIYDQFTFRAPTLGDAIKHEKHFSNPIVFWRKIAFDCIMRIYSKQANLELLSTVKNILGSKLFDEYLFKDDLEKIRTELRDRIPTIPFSYEEECPSINCRKKTPVSMEMNYFFSA